MPCLIVIWLEIYKKFSFFVIASISSSFIHFSNNAFKLIPWNNLISAWCESVLYSGFTRGYKPHNRQCVNAFESVISSFVEQSIRNSRGLDDSVYHLLDKMENLQQTRSLRWEERMRKLAGEREEIAKLLVKTLEMIEHETGIFLIKPIMSVPSR